MQTKNYSEKMKRALKLSSWNIASDQHSDDRDYDHPSLDDVQRELSISPKRKVDLSDNWGLSIEYGYNLGVVFEAGTSCLILSVDSVTENEIAQLFSWFYDGKFELLLNHNWSQHLGHFEITLETIQHLAEQTTDDDAKEDH